MASVRIGTTHAPASSPCSTPSQGVVAPRAHLRPALWRFLTVCFCVGLLMPLACGSFAAGGAPLWCPFLGRRGPLLGARQQQAGGGPRPGPARGSAEATGVGRGV